MGLPDASKCIGLIVIFKTIRGRMPSCPLYFLSALSPRVDALLLHYYLLKNKMDLPGKSSGDVHDLNTFLRQSVKAENFLSYSRAGPENKLSLANSIDSLTDLFLIFF